jgi:two-component system response regulator DesR
VAVVGEDAGNEVVRVVMCDDSFGFRSLVRARLRADDRLELVGMAEDVGQLRRLLPSTRPDVVLLDLVLPDGDDPVALVAELRAAKPGLRIVLVSSLVAGELERTAASAGVDSYANKATTGPELCDLLWRVARAPRAPVGA